VKTVPPTKFQVSNTDEHYLLERQYSVADTGTMRQLSRFFADGVNRIKGEVESKDTLNQ
jgi:hypothetical protein